MRTLAPAAQLLAQVSDLLGQGLVLVAHALNGVLALLVLRLEAEDFGAVLTRLLLRRLQLGRDALALHLLVQKSVIDQSSCNFQEARQPLRLISEEINVNGN